MDFVEAGGEAAEGDDGGEELEEAEEALQPEVDG